MTIDLIAASRFMATHARILDRRRFELLVGRGDPANALAALAAHRNPDGGYGAGLEPDLRSSESQPGPALHAFEVFADVAPIVAPEAAGLCDWLATASLPDGGLPFALPVDDPAGCAPFWAEADPTTSSLQITAIVVATALRVAAHDPAVDAHPWLAGAIDHCVDAVAALDEEPHALVLGFALQALDAAHDRHPGAEAGLAHLARWVPDDGIVHVGGGLEDEVLRPLDLAPRPDRPTRALLRPEVVAADLDRLAGQQADDGGWPLEWAAYSPAAELEWRGALTVRALELLAANGRLDLPSR